jgi:hypothetical protein
MSTFNMQPQEANEWCWAAVGVSVDKYIAPDSSWTQSKLVAQMFPDCKENPCDKPASLSEALDALQRQVGDPIFGPLSFAQIRQTIDAGWPIPVRIVWDDNAGNGHFVVISGYSMSRSGIPLLQVDDPFYDRSIVEYATFVSSYHGVGRWEQTYRVLG